MPSSCSNYFHNLPWGIVPLSIYKEKLEERKKEFSEKLINIYNSLYPQNEDASEITNKA